MFQTSASKLGASLRSLKFLKSRGCRIVIVSVMMMSPRPMSLIMRVVFSDFSEPDSEHDETSTGNSDIDADPEPVASISKHGHI